MPFESLYVGDRHSSRGRITIPNYSPPAILRHATWELVAEIPAEPGGYNVRVYEMRLPATSYRIEALPTPNSMNEPRDGFVLSTGTGMHDIVGPLAKAIAEGMLGPDPATFLDPENPDAQP